MESKIIVKRARSKDNNTFKVGDIVVVDNSILKVKVQSHYIIKTAYSPNEKILPAISGISGAANVAGRTFEISDMRTDGFPSVVINGKKTVLVRIKDIVVPTALYLMPIMFLRKKVLKYSNLDDYEYVDSVRRIHISILEHPDMEQPLCTWWRPSGYREFSIKVGSFECHKVCPLKLFSKDGYIYCRGEYEGLRVNQNSSDDA